jgi:hypothetical protein
MPEPQPMSDAELAEERRHAEKGAIYCMHPLRLLATISADRARIAAALRLCDDNEPAPACGCDGWLRASEVRAALQPPQENKCLTK